MQDNTRPQPSPQEAAAQVVWPRGRCARATGPYVEVESLFSCFFLPLSGLGDGRLFEPPAPPPPKDQACRCCVRDKGVT